MLARMSREVRAVGAIEGSTRSALAWVAELETLEDVLRRELAVLEVVVQDEYTHDVVTRHGDVFVVFDTT